MLHELNTIIFQSSGHFVSDALKRTLGHAYTGNVCFNFERRGSICNETEYNKNLNYFINDLYRFEKKTATHFSIV